MARRAPGLLTALALAAAPAAAQLRAVEVPIGGRAGIDSLSRLGFEVESLQKFHRFFGDALKVECPAGSSRRLNLWQVATDLSRRLNRLFLPGADGRRPVYGGTEVFQQNPHWRGLVPFHEYFHGDNGAGIGASQQTGWTGLVAKLLQQSGE